MKLTFRRLLLRILLVPSITALIAVAVVWIAWLGASYGHESAAVKMLWWGMMRNSEPQALMWSLIAVSIFVVFGFFGTFLLRRSESLNPSPEIFFMRVFLLTLSFQCIRLVLPLVFDRILPISYGLMATRIAWFGRFLGITILFNISLYSNDMPFRHTGSVINIGALASLCFAATIPLDITQPMSNLLYRTGLTNALSVSFLTLEILTIITLFGVAVKRRKRRYFILTSGMLLLISGYDMLFFGHRATIIPAFLLMSAGLSLFLFQSRKTYIWL